VGVNVEVVSTMTTDCDAVVGLDVIVEGTTTVEGTSEVVGVVVTTVVPEAVLVSTEEVAEEVSLAESLPPVDKATL
jgi:hypothetical protein